MSINKKVVLVTGASRGIGESIAVYLGQQGMTVLGTATQEDGAKKITDLLHDKHCEGKGYVMNLRKPETITEALAAMKSDFDAPLILVNNAGMTDDNILLRMKDEQWNSVIETNLNGVFHLTKACLKPMIRARFGRIINISSVVASMGSFGQANYVASKAGLLGFTKALAIELAGFGITANAVAPGFIQTEMTAAVSEQHQEAYLNRIPLNRMGKPIEVAYAVGFLVSDQASYITGETLNVNGGMYLD